PFDPDRLSVTGAAHSLHDNIADTDFHHYVFSGSSGVLGFSTFDPRSRLHLVDRAGEELGVFGEPADWVAVSWSPDGRRAVVERVDSERREEKPWMADLTRGAFDEFPIGRAGTWNVPLWSPDSSEILYQAGTSAADLAIYTRRSDGGGERKIMSLSGDRAGFVSTWVGDWVAAETFAGKNLADVVAVSLRDGKLIPIATTPEWENSATFSMDGRWIAYQASGKIIVQPFPPTGAQFTVSSPVPGGYHLWRGGGVVRCFVGCRGIVLVG